MIEKIKIRGYRIFREFEVRPNTKLNLLVGDNESGKSTLIEAICLALTGRINGRWAAEELNPYWFNRELVSEFVQSLRAGEPAAWPEIKIELFLDNRDDLQQLCGAVNSDVPTNACPGVSLSVLPNPDYSEDLEGWLSDPSELLPVEYYRADWRTFADLQITARPRQLVTAVIDSRTLRSSRGIDYHLRQILSDQFDTAERASISLAYRQSKASMSDEALKTVNDRMAEVHASLHDQPITLAMDQSARTSWEGAVTPHVDSVPFSMSGLGQQAAIKISLAMNRHSEHASFVIIEEPENHLTHTSLAILLARIEELAGDHQQLFISTHSSFVLNRLGLDSLHLLGNGSLTQFSGLSTDTVRYFQRLPGYDTLRMVLARKLVLVEGPSDEIIFQRVFYDLYAKKPMDLGIDVLSIRGLSFKRCLELCAKLDKQVAAVRDNDGLNLEDLNTGLVDWLVEGRRQLFVGHPDAGDTLEPQLVAENGEEKIRRVLGITDAADLSTWMKREKTEGALRIAESDEAITPPAYLREAAAFIHG